MLALVSALLVAIGTLVRQRSSTSSGGITKRWWIGVGIAALGFVVQAVALGLGTLLLVQPLIVLSVLFALPMEAYLDHRRLSFHEWKWGIILTVCVAAFVALALPTGNKNLASGPTVAYSTVVVIAILVALVVGAKFASPHYRALLFGSASGLLTGVQSFLVKIVTGQFSDGMATPFLHPELYLIIVVALGSVVTQQLAFAAHDLQTSFPAMTVIEPVSAMALGVALLGERTQTGLIGALAASVVFLVMLWAVVVLAKHAAEREGEYETPHVAVEHDRHAA